MQNDGENDTFTKSEVEAIAGTAADRAIARLFDKLDIDVNHKDSLITLRDNLRFLDEQRQGQEILRQNMKKGALYLAGTATLEIIYLMWDIFKAGLAEMFTR